MDSLNDREKFILTERRLPKSPRRWKSSPKSMASAASAARRFALSQVYLAPASAASASPGERQIEVTRKKISIAALPAQKLSCIA
jgi:hypothetical protein